MDDEMRLISKIQKKGDRVAADALIRKYYDEIYCFVYKQTTNKENAMDLTQEIFTSMLQTIRFYVANQAGFRTWLYRIATNKLVDFYRAYATYNKHTLEIDELELPDEVDFVKQLEAKNLLERVNDYVNGLPSDIQKIFRLKFWGEYTFAQIASFIFMPEASVKTKYYRLLNRLRKEFIDEYE